MSDNPPRADVAFRGNQLICLALLIGQFFYGVVIYILQRMGSFGESFAGAAIIDVLPVVGIGVGAVSIPTAIILRKSIWRRAGSDDVAVLQSYFTGNIAFQAALEGASLLNLSFWLVTAEAMPFLAVAAVVFVVGLTGIPRRAPATGGPAGGGIEPGGA